MKTLISSSLIAPPRSGFGNQVGERQVEVLGRKRLDHVLVGAPFHRLDGGRGVAQGRDHHQAGVRLQGHHLGDAGQAEICPPSLASASRTALMPTPCPASSVAWSAVEKPGWKIIW